MCACGLDPGTSSPCELHGVGGLACCGYKHTPLAQIQFARFVCQCVTDLCCTIVYSVAIAGMISENDLAAWNQCPETLWFLIV